MKNFLIVFAIILGLAGVGYGIYALSNSTSNPSPSTSTTSQAQSSNSNAVSPSSTGSSGATITSAQLAQNNGKNGAKCWVAVNGTIYDVSGSKDWQNGVHTPSNGQAQCGRDESAVIGKAPHGSSVLSSLPVVGTLQ